MTNNSSSTDIISECRKASMPFKVIFDNTVYISAKNFNCYPYTSCFPPKKKEESIESRFDILDIRFKETYGLTIEQVSKYFNKIREDINNPFIWKYDEERKPVVSGDCIVKMVEEEIEEAIRNSIEEFIESRWIGDRLEILDL